VGLQLVGIGVRHRDVIPVEAAHDHFANILQCRDDPPAHTFPDHHLARMGKQPIALAARRQAGGADDLVIPDLDQAAQTSYCERFGSWDLDAFVAPSAAPSHFPPDGRSSELYRGCSGCSRRSPNSSLMVSTRASSSIGLSRKTSTGR
jgi:hypothetical protein